MVFLYILLGIAALITLLLSVPLIVQAEYGKELTLRLRWLFLRIPIVPAKEKKPKKKKKKEKPAKEKEEKPKEEKDPNKPNVIQRFYQYQGIPGFIDLLRRTVEILKKFRHGVWLCFKIRKLHLQMLITGGEPQALVEKYGKTCAAVFPALGWLSSHLRTKRGGVKANISPDFTGFAKQEIAVDAEISICPLVLICAALSMLVRLGFRVVLRFFKGAKPPKAPKTEAANAAPAQGNQAAMAQPTPVATTSENHIIK